MLQLHTVNFLKLSTRPKFSVTVTPLYSFFDFSFLFCIFTMGLLIALLYIWTKTTVGHNRWSWINPDRLVHFVIAFWCFVFSRMLAPLELRLITLDEVSKICEAELTHLSAGLPDHNPRQFQWNQLIQFRLFGCVSNLYYLACSLKYTAHYVM